VHIDGEEVDNVDLIICDGSVRGKFNEGLHIRGRLVNIIKDGIKTLMLDVIDGFDITHEKFREGVLHLKTQRKKEKTSHTGIIH
jgi:hypothetical protein